MGELETESAGTYDNIEDNFYYHATFGWFILKQYFPYAPFWTSILTKVRLCNSSVENHFKTIKEQVINEKSVPIHRFANRVKDHFEARLKAIESGIFLKKVKDFFFFNVNFCFYTLQKNNL
jgi:hypothetical protein